MNQVTGMLGRGGGRRSSQSGRGGMAGKAVSFVSGFLSSDRGRGGRRRRY